jgi:hypothetical protein
MTPSQVNTKSYRQHNNITTPPLVNDSSSTKPCQPPSSTKPPHHGRTPQQDNKHTTYLYLYIQNTLFIRKQLPTTNHLHHSATTRTKKADTACIQKYQLYIHTRQISTPEARTSQKKRPSLKQRVRSIYTCTKRCANHVCQTWTKYTTYNANPNQSTIYEKFLVLAYLQSKPKRHPATSKHAPTRLENNAVIQWKTGKVRKRKRKWAIHLTSDDTGTRRYVQTRIKISLGFLLGALVYSRSIRTRPKNYHLQHPTQ